MTSLQQVLFRLGAWRLQRFRRWVGGRWAWRYRYCGRAHWEIVDSYDAYTYAIEQWPQRLPRAQAKLITKRTRT